MSIVKRYSPAIWPVSSLYEPSPTTIELPVRMASAILFPSSPMIASEVAHVHSGGPCLSLWRSVLSSVARIKVVLSVVVGAGRLANPVASNFPSSLKITILRRGV